MLNQQGMHINFDMKLQSLCGVVFLCLLCACFTKPFHLGVNWPTTLCENKDGVLFSPSISNAIIGITSYYCEILKMMMLHDVIKTILNGVFPFSLEKRTKSCFFLKNPKNDFLNRFFLKAQKNRWVVFLKKKKTSFCQPCCEVISLSKVRICDNCTCYVKTFPLFICVKIHSCVASYDFHTHHL